MFFYQNKNSSLEKKPLYIYYIFFNRKNTNIQKPVITKDKNTRIMSPSQSWWMKRLTLWHATTSKTAGSLCWEETNFRAWYTFSSVSIIHSFSFLTNHTSGRANLRRHCKILLYFYKIQCKEINRGYCNVLSNIFFKICFQYPYITLKEKKNRKQVKFMQLQLVSPIFLLFKTQVGHI